mmetsp:Transcript_76059/g.126785  ORF Transcript_76059/g.126785 Transcript_76059/m.126785 type:complete len:102 (+) Transcript_76059:33-338(+)
MNTFCKHDSLRFVFYYCYLQPSRCIAYCEAFLLDVRLRLEEGVDVRTKDEPLMKFAKPVHVHQPRLVVLGGPNRYELLVEAACGAWLYVNQKVVNPKHDLT